MEFRELKIIAFTQAKLNWSPFYHTFLEPKAFRDF